MKKKPKLKLLDDKSGLAIHSSVERTIEDVLKDVRSGETPEQKCVVIFLSSEDEGLKVHKYVAGMNLADIILALELAKAQYLGLT